MTQWSSTDICGMQVNRVDCETGAVLVGALDVALTCSVADYSRTAVLTDEVVQEDPSGRAGKNRARRVIPARPDYYTYSFTLDSQFDAELMVLLGLVNPVFNPMNPTEIIGVKDLDHVSGTDDCCPPGGACADTEVALLMWHVAWCDTNRHPDYLYDIHFVPRIKFTVTDDAVERGTGFRTMTIEGRTEKPLAGYARGPANIWPEVAGLNRQWANLLSNTPFPAGCACSTCAA
jgi:hypothetical protein